MLDSLLNVLGNPHFEAWVAGPIVGGVLGTVFSTLAQQGNVANPANSANATRTPAEVREALSIERAQRPQRREVHHHHHYHSQKQGDDAFPIIVLFAVALVCLGSLLFAAYLPVIADSLYWLTASIACFALASTLVSLFSRRFDTTAWWWHAVAPVVASLLAFYVATVAHASITPEVIHFAQGLLGGHPLTVHSLIASGMAFVRGIGMNYVNWMLFEMFAFVILFAISLICAFQCVYYVALANVRDAAGGFWEFLVLASGWVDGTGAKVVVWLGLPFAWFLASGQFYLLVSH